MKCQSAVGLVDGTPRTIQLSWAGSVIEEANIQVLQYSGNLQGWEVGDVQCELWL